MLEKNEMYKMLDEHPEYKSLLFCKGYLITNNKNIDNSVYPFCLDHWSKISLGRFDIWHDNRTQIFVERSIDRILFLIGHAYNPFSMEKNETVFLNRMNKETDESKFWEKEAELTGIYVMGTIVGDKVSHWVDCTGMFPALYGKIDDDIYITSHVKIVGDMLNLREDKYVTQLKNYKHFHYFGNILPGDITPYTELKRSVPNHVYCFEKSDITKKRFFPQKKLTNCETEAEYQEVLKETALLMRNTLMLCAKKWPDKAVAISVTGGKDSGVTLASARKQYREFKYFSYDSSREEHPDVIAAESICKGIGIEHESYKIPANNNEYVNYDVVKDIMAYNAGNIIYNNDNDVRKRAFFLEHQHFDIEIKSWVNEIGRARYYKRFNKRSFPNKVKAKYCTALYKPFFENRRLKIATDKIFQEYIDSYISMNNSEIIPWLIQMYWEFSWSACEGMHMIAEHMIAYDITIPFNNRKLVEMLLKPTLSDRMNDRLQKDIIELNNPDITKMNISVKDVNYSDKRAKAEKIYFNITSRLPF